MGKHGGYLMTLMLCAMLAKGGESKPPQQQQQQEQQREEKRLANDLVGPWIHISSTVLQLVPATDEQTHLLLPPPAAQEAGHAPPGSIYFPVSHIHRLEGLLPLGESRHSEVSDNLDLPRSVKSHGR